MVAADSDALPPREPLASAHAVSAEPAWVSRADDVKMMRLAAAGAVALHVAFLFVDLPERKASPPPPPVAPEPTRIIEHSIPPPPAEARPVELVDAERLLPVPMPDPQPAPAEPVDERTAPIDFDRDRFPLDVIELVPPVAPPPSSDPAPRLPGVGGVTHPVLIQDSRVEPVYPEPARRARFEGTVVLRAVIDTDGAVRKLELLRCNPCNLGFEEAAMEAVARWRYEPARLNGRPVAVVFTVLVSFTLN